MFSLLLLASGRTACANTFTWFGGSGSIAVAENCRSTALGGSGSIANSPDIILAGGATFDVSGLLSAFTLGSSQTLSNSASTGTLNCGSVGAATGSGTLSLTYASGTPSLRITSGTLSLSSGTVVNINNTGTALNAGAYAIIAAARGSVGGILPASLNVTGGAIAAGKTASLQFSGGSLDLVVTTLPPPAITSISVNGPTLTITATNGAYGGKCILLESASLTLALSQWTPVLTNTFNGSGALNLSTNIINPNNPQEFYLLQVP